MLYKLQILLLLIALLVTACGKDTDNASISNILTSHNWKFYQSHNLEYDSAATGWVLINDFMHYATNCNKQTEYVFLKNNDFKTISDCVNIFDSTGKWSVSADSVLNALIPQQVLNLRYYFGIAGKLTEIEAHQFITTSYQVVYIYNNTIVHKDSSVVISTFKD